MDIDSLSNGRLILGLGSGAINTNRKWHGSENFDKPSERMSSLIKILKNIQKAYIMVKILNLQICSIK